MHNKKSYHKEIEKALFALKNGNTILYPTDTVWGLGCDATNKQAVEKVFKLKKRNSSKSLIILVNNIQMLEKYINNIPTKALEFIKTVNTPTSIIYSNPKALADNVIAEDNTVGIRVVNDKFCKDLITAFGKPIVSTSANISGDASPKQYSEIHQDILESVNYIIDITPEFSNNKASKIVKIEGESIKIIRE